MKKSIQIEIFHILKKTKKRFYIFIILINWLLIKINKINSQYVTEIYQSKSNKALSHCYYYY